jgi:hypothetical protein
MATPDKPTTKPPTTPASPSPPVASSSAPAEPVTPTRTAALTTEESTGNTGVAGPEISDPPFTVADLEEIELAGSPFYQLASKIKQALGEREIVAELGNTERVYAMDKELSEYRRAWDERPDIDREEGRSTPPIGRQTRQERQIRTGGETGTPTPQPALSPSSSTAASTAVPPPPPPPPPAKTAPTPPASGTAGTPTGGSEAKP